MLKKLLLVIGSLGLITVAACGGDDDDNNSSSAGVPSDKQISSLTQEDLDKICKSLDEQYKTQVTPLMPTAESYTKSYCTVISLFTSMNGGTKETCEAAVTDCVARASAADANDSTDDQDAGADTVDCWEISDFAGCTATVAELDACNTASIGAAKKSIESMKALWGGRTCDTAGQPLDQSILSELTSQDDTNTDAQLPECKVVSQKCPATDGGI